MSRFYFSSPSVANSISLAILGSGGVPFTQLELLEATHRGLHKFIPRHHDEIDLEIGDPIYVQKEADDLWCEGVNLRTGRQGIFPSAYAVDMDYSDFDPSAPKVKRERYLLGYLGSVETLAHKGTGVVCQAVRRIVGNTSEDAPDSQKCILEVSDQGLRMVDRSKPRVSQSCIPILILSRKLWDLEKWQDTFLVGNFMKNKKGVLTCFAKSSSFHVICK